MQDVFFNFKKMKLSLKRAKIALLFFGVYILIERKTELCKPNFEPLLFNKAVNKINDGSPELICVSGLEKDAVCTGLEGCHQVIFKD